MQLTTFVTQLPVSIHRYAILQIFHNNTFLKCMKPHCTDFGLFSTNIINTSVITNIGKHPEGIKSNFHIYVYNVDDNKTCLLQTTSDAAKYLISKATTTLPQKKNVLIVFFRKNPRTVLVRPSSSAYSIVCCCNK